MNPIKKDVRVGDTLDIKAVDELTKMVTHDWTKGDAFYAKVIFDVIALTQIEMPLMLLPLLTIMNQMDQNLVDASRALGASKWRTFFQVILPQTLPGWIAGATLVFASATTAFISQSVIAGARLVHLPPALLQQ